ncbi:hypothetical protein, partial [Faecalibaculum rodentium]|uniref:hypothetical protein n=1 Tax=Faecalibaculum rodentium TaxID=1702221 RepID=UPI00255AFF94
YNCRAVYEIRTYGSTRGAEITEFPLYSISVPAMADEQVVSYGRFLILCPVAGAVIGFTINTETKQT